MHKSAMIIFLGLNLSCNQKDNSTKESIPQDSLSNYYLVDIYPDTFNKSKENNLSEELSYEYYDSQFLKNNKISDYLKDKNIPNEFKNLFLNKNVIYSKQTFSICDSIFSTDSYRQPFYLLTFSRSMRFCDGAFAEVIGSKTLIFIQNKPKQFCEFYAEGLINKEDYKNWIEHISNESAIQITSGVKDFYQNLKKQTFKNCNDCKKTDIKLLNKIMTDIDSSINSFNLYYP